MKSSYHTKSASFNPDKSLIQKLLLKTTPRILVLTTGTFGWHSWILIDEVTFCDSLLELYSSIFYRSSKEPLELITVRHNASSHAMCSKWEFPRRFLGAPSTDLVKSFTPLPRFSQRPTWTLTASLSTPLSVITPRPWYRQVSPPLMSWTLSHVEKDSNFLIRWSSP